MTPTGWPGERAGFLNRLYAPDDRPELFRDAVALIADAEALGLGSAWVAQHHFGSETGRLPAPLLLLAHASHATRRLRLGTAVVVLPLEPVLRLAEDAAVLDVLSGGRLELGLGTGFDGAAFVAFGEDASRRATIYDERIAPLMRIIAGGSVSAEHPEFRLQPAAPGLRSRVWESRSAVEVIAARGNGLIVAPRPGGGDDSAALIRRYRAAWRESGGDGAPRVVLVCGVFPGRDAASVEAEIGPDIMQYVHARATTTATGELADILRRLGVAWGSPAQIVDQLATSGALDGVDQLVAQVQTFSTSYATARRRLELFTHDVLPQLPLPIGTATC
jgi:alkanesulfonate monooxygenase SsuD/methylene tetrahydromethanopterin reductase-like flavin-dependent oxidoreductase (luciferase family)